MTTHSSRVYVGREICQEEVLKLYSIVLKYLLVFLENTLKTPHYKPPYNRNFHSRKRIIDSHEI